MHVQTTYGERLEIDRRRLDETQARTAARLGLTVYAYRKAEASAFRGQGDPEDPSVEPTPAETCRIFRRRQGRKVRDIAKALNLTPWWVSRMERGDVPADLLVDYWRMRYLRQVEVLV